MHFLVIFW